MDISQLENFAMIARYENLTRAAQEIGISQPALSLSLSRLEAELDARLFDRVGRRICLNEAGRIFLKYAQSMLQEKDNAQSELAEYLQRRRKLITVSTSSKLSLEMAFFSYRRDFPEMELSVRDAGAGVLADIDAKTCDFGVVSDMDFDRYGCEYQVVFSERLLLAVPAGHRLCGRSEVSVSELKNERFVALPVGGSYRAVADGLCQRAGFKRGIAHETYMCMQRSYVARGLGVAFVSDSLLKSCFGGGGADVEYIPLSAGTPECKTALLWHRERRLTAEERQFVDYIRDFSM